MKFRNFLTVADTRQQQYFKEGVELIYPDQSKPLRIAILPAYDRSSPDPTGWVPAVNGDDESDFYTVVRAAKFVGHGNRRAKTSFLSPKTFDPSADDPYDAFYDYCCRSDKWSYLTKDRRGRRLSGEVEGAVFTKAKNFFVANVVDASAGPRGGVFLTELSESVMKGILYTRDRSGGMTYGLALGRGDDGELLYGDITDPEGALVIEVAMCDRKYVARPQLDSKGRPARMKIPSTLLQHRAHVEDPGSFLVHPGGGQQIVDRIASMLRGYRNEDGEDEVNALREAMEFAYGKGAYSVDGDAAEDAGPDPFGVEVSPPDPFAGAEREVVESVDEQKAESVDDAVERGVERERYVPSGGKKGSKGSKGSKEGKEGTGKKAVKKPEKDLGATETDTGGEDDIRWTPGEDVDPSDIESIRRMLSGGK